VVLILTLLTYTTAVASESADPVRVHVERMLAAQARWHQAKKTEPITWKDVTTSEDLDSDGKVTDRDVDVYQSVLILGRPYVRHVLHNGKPLTGKALKEAQEAERAFTEKARAGQVDEEKKIFSFDRTLMERFDFTLAGLAERRGQPCTLLKFHPRKRSMPELRPEERVLNSLQGELCVHPEEGGIVDLHAYLPEPMSVGFVLGRVSTVDVVYQQDRMPDGLWAPTFFRMRVNARALVKKYNQRVEVTWSEMMRAALTPPATPPH